MDFRVKSVLHVAGLLVTVSLLSWCLANTRYYATMLTLGVMLCFQVAALLRHVRSTNREISRFLGAIRHADFSQSFRRLSAGAGFRELGDSFEQVMDRFRRERSGREEQASHLQAFVRQMPVALLSLEEDGAIALSNPAFSRLCGRFGPVHHLDQVKQADKALGDFLEALRPGQDQSLKLSRRGQPRHLKLSCTLLRSKGKRQKLVSIQDIQGELEGRELEAWQNLIRVMTHEIMNSVTPIASLADTSGKVVLEASRQLAAASGDEARADIQDLLDDAGQGLSTISSRSQGLLRFVESYRKLTRLPAPDVRSFAVLELLRSVESLMQDQAGGCEMRYRCAPVNLEMRADPEQIEQALINLVKNALDAVEGVDSPTISVEGELADMGKVLIRVRDNGCGIDKENLDNIFVPFFTTKRGGSGIGMSMVRQIVRLNGGKMAVESAPGRGTTMLLTF